MKMKDKKIKMKDRLNERFNEFFIKEIKEDPEVYNVSEFIEELYYAHNNRSALIKRKKEYEKQIEIINEKLDKIKLESYEDKILKIVSETELRWIKTYSIPSLRKESKHTVFRRYKSTWGNTILSTKQFDLIINYLKKRN